MSDQETPSADETDSGAESATMTGASFDKRWLIGGLAALVVALAVALVVVLLSDEDASVDTSSTTTTTTTSTTTTSAVESTTSGDVTTTSAVSGPTDEELATVVWPGPDMGVRYTEPQAAAQAFATQVLRFGDPVLGEFQQGDSRSGEIEVRPDSQGPVTTVFVRRLSDDSWWVLGSATAAIELDNPTSGSTIVSPATLTGRSSAFEAVVNVSVFELGSTTLLGKGIVMGSGDADLGPFSGEVSFDPSPGTRGVVVLYKLSAKDGTVTEAIATPVRFG